MPEPALPAFNGQAFNGQAFNGQAFNGQAFNGQAFNGQARAEACKSVKRDLVCRKKETY
jgi:hypothetical protein